MEITRQDIVRMTNGMHAASMLLLERNEKLEQLCRDLYECVSSECHTCSHYIREEFRVGNIDFDCNQLFPTRMADLGLFGG